MLHVSNQPCCQDLHIYRLTKVHAIRLPKINKREIYEPKKKKNHTVAFLPTS